MSDKIKKLVNEVVLIGKVAEIEVKEGQTKEKGIPYVSVKGSIQFGEGKAETKKFDTFIQETNKDGKVNKKFEPTLDFANNCKSIAKDGYEEATVVKLSGEFYDNVYFSEKNNKIVESVGIKSNFYDTNVKDDFVGYARVEGYIQSIVEETKGEDEELTGRLRMTLLTADFFGNIIPVKNIIIPADLVDDFNDMFEEGQTVLFSLDFVVNKKEAAPKQGGIGKKRVTEGKSYVELVLAGAEEPNDEENSISPEAIKIGLSERNVKIAEIKEKGENGEGKSKTTKSVGAKRTGLAGKKIGNKGATSDSSDMPF